MINNVICDSVTIDTKEVTVENKFELVLWRVLHVEMYCRSCVGKKLVGDFN